MLAAMLAGFGFAGNVFAECQGDPGELVVHVNDDTCPLTSAHNTPLFTVSNIAPGDSATGTLRVKNAGAAPQTLIIEAVNFADPLPDDNLARALNITISLQNGSGYIYNDILANFFKEREYKLAENFAGGADYTYKVVVYFPADKGNDWQEKSTSFDLMVGFQGSDSKGATLATISGGGTGGGQTRGLLIQNEMAATVTAESATITWTTNRAATSWVIYAKDGESYSLDLAKANYGYPRSTAEDANKVSSHSVTITGLEPNTTYYYRCVSHASLAVSVDHSFTTLPGGQVAGASTEKDDDYGLAAAEPLAGGGQKSSSGQVLGAATSTGETLPPEQGNENEAETVPTAQTVPIAVTAASVKACGFDFPWWTFLLLAAICGWRGWANKKTRGYWLMASFVPLAAAGWTYFNSAFCLNWKIFAVLAVVLLGALIFEKLSSKNHADKN